MSRFPDFLMNPGIKQKEDSMNRGKTFRSRFDMRLHQLQDTADHMQDAVKDQAAMLAEQTRDGLMRGQKALSGWERSLERAVRDNPMLYFGSALAVIGLLLAALLMPRRK